MPAQQRLTRRSAPLDSPGTKVSVLVRIGQSGGCWSGCAGQSDARSLGSGFPPVPLLFAALRSEQDFPVYFISQVLGALTCSVREVRVRVPRVAAGGAVSVSKISCLSRSVLIPVVEIVKEINLRVVVVHQLEFVVPVVGWLATPRHDHHLPCPTV